MGGFCFAHLIQLSDKMTLALTTIFFVLGLIIGSFLNVVILRYNTQKTFGGRSACMSCQSTLCWYDLIPLASFFILGGRCRNCKTKISLQYPVVELVTGTIFAGLFLKFQDIFYFSAAEFSVVYAYYTAMFSLLLVIAVYDLKHKIIPDKLSLMFGICTFIGLFLFTNNDFFSDFTIGFYPHVPSIFEFLSGLVISVPFALFWLVSRGAWMGLGDAKLAVGLGFLLGIGKVLSAAVLSFWLGALIGIVLIIFSRKHGMKTEIPFAPFLVLGTLIAFLFEVHIFPL